MEIKKSKDERISALLEEAIAFHNEVNVKLGDSHEGYSYQTFADAVCSYASSQNIVRRSVSQIFNNHEDLLRKFDRFLSDSHHHHRHRHQATSSFSESIPLEDQKDAKALESQTIKFLMKLRNRMGDDGVAVFVFEFQHDSWTRGLDETKIKSVAEECLGEFPDLMEEFDDIYQRYIEVDRIFLRTHEGMNNFDRLIKYAFARYEHAKSRRNLDYC